MINELFDHFETLTIETLKSVEKDTENKFYKLKLDLEKKDILKFYNEFNDCIWRFEDLQNFTVRNITFFDFPQKNITKLNLSKFQYTLKSWALYQLESQYDLHSIAKKIKIVKDALTESNFFDFEKCEYFKESFFSNLSERNKYIKASALNDYLSYTEYPIDEEYMLYILETLQSNKNFEVLNRTIPSSKDTLKFSLIIEDYFRKKLSTKQYLKYYPIHLWWNLTNIIPLRISEFCLIRQDCINKIDEEYFITLPRSKNLFNRKLRWDQLWIPTELAESILEYKEKTTDLGVSKTLLHYFSTKSSPTKQCSEEELNIFLYNNFSNLLDTFYSEVIKDEYGFSIIEDNESFVSSQEKFMIRRVRPNDTRHFAFLNLMLQGYDPPEIARLGGHKSIYSQYSYHQHLEYWVDSDLINLFLTKGHMLNDVSGSFFQKVIFKKAIFNPEVTFYPNSHKLALGICLDPEQNCEVDEHYLCKHWRITENGVCQYSCRIKLLYFSIKIKIYSIQIPSSNEAIALRLMAC